MSQPWQETNIEGFRKSDAAETVQDKGRILEDLVCTMFESVPGIKLTERNEVTAFNAEEIDIGVWNDQYKRGFEFLPNVILIECKNWSNPIGSQEVASFVTRLRNRGLRFGILVAANGVTGDQVMLTEAHATISGALREGIQVIVITREEIEQLTSVGALITLLKRKMLRLAVKATSLL